MEHDEHKKVRWDQSLINVPAHVAISDLGSELKQYNWGPWRGQK